MILGSVVGEKQPELCSALFCYLDSIWEAHWVYSETAWLRYDKQFWQCMSALILIGVIGILAFGCES